MDPFWSYGLMIAGGAGWTLALIIAVIPVGIVLGLLGAAAKLSSWRLLRFLSESYTTFIRAMPELLVIFLVFFGGARAFNWLLAGIGFPEIQIDFNPFVAGVIALGVVQGAFATEVFRAALLAVPVGQTEAAQACGFTRWQTFRFVTLPQVWRLALPGLGNLLQILIKDTALISVVGLADIMRNAQIAAGATKQPFTFLLLAAAVYLLFTTVATAVMMLLERRANHAWRRA